mmetsp:Transcript_25970/g.51202  ORF Transcript_25970/g.51202 Transcript_25970/m.51202 type:complete len:216 (-) Transcript_25970:125-772(-)
MVHRFLELLLRHLLVAHSVEHGVRLFQSLHFRLQLDVGGHQLLLHTLQSVDSSSLCCHGVPLGFHVQSRGFCFSSRCLQNCSFGLQLGDCCLVSLGSFVGLCGLVDLGLDLGFETLSFRCHCVVHAQQRLELALHLGEVGLDCCDLGLGFGGTVQQLSGFSGHLGELFVRCVASLLQGLVVSCSLLQGQLRSLQVTGRLLPLLLHFFASQASRRA